MQSVSDGEIDWMLQQRPLVHDPQQLEVDYGDEAATMLDALSEQCSELMPLLAWHGVTTRWRHFLQWVRDTGPGTDIYAVFAAFARHLGRLTAYRALALTQDGFQRLQEMNTILASGRVKADTATVAAYLREQGLRKILDMRMRKLGELRYDPSLSLHDHPETAVCVAAGYLGASDRLVYRFELDVPVIEVIGWRMCDVNGWVGWFSHRGIWFDPTNPRTERFMLREIPWFAERCRSIRIFHTEDEVAAYLGPFREEQARIRNLALATARSSQM